MGFLGWTVWADKHARDRGLHPRFSSPTCCSAPSRSESVGAMPTYQVIDMCTYGNVTGLNNVEELDNVEGWIM